MNDLDPASVPWTFSELRAARPAWVGAVVTASAVALGLWGGRNARTSDVDGYGLILALPPAYWLSIVLAVAATLLLLWPGGRGEDRNASWIPILWLLVLHTGPQLAHSHVRQPEVWRNLGLVRSLEQNQTGDALIDNVLAWPGFFGTFAAPFGLTDSAMTEGLLRLWPTLTTGTVAVLVAALARRAYPTVPAVGPLASLVYVLVAWIGYDYFSAMGPGILAYMAVLVIIEGGPLRTGSAFSASIPLLPRLAVSGGDRPTSRSTPAFVALVVLGLGTIVSHPVAPLMISGALLVLGLYGRTVAWRLLALVGTAFLLWSLLVAQPSLSDPVDGSAGLSGLLDAVVGNNAESTADGSSERQLVHRMRLFVGLGTIVAAVSAGGMAAVERFRHLRPTSPLVILTLAPLVLSLPFGLRDEVVGSALAFALPVASVLVARTLASRDSAVGALTVAIGCAAFSPMFLIARYGDEPFEYATLTDRAAVAAAYARASDNALLVADSGFLPWRDQTLRSNTFIERAVEPSEQWVADIRELAQRLGRDRILVVLTDSQAGWRIHGQGAEAGGFEEISQWLLDQPEAELVFHEGGAWVIEL